MDPLNEIRLVQSLDQIAQTLERIALALEAKK